MCAVIRIELWDQTWDESMGRLTDRAIKTVGKGRYGDGEESATYSISAGLPQMGSRYQLNCVRRYMGLGPGPSIDLSDSRFAVGNAHVDR
jgi:hypothetical protein